jgi:RNA polymerase sigma factor (sigma-70 family)
MRRRLVARKHAPTPPGDTMSAEHDAIAHENQREVVAALRRLPPRQREALVLRYYGDLSEAEIAATMSCSPGTVKSHIHRGKAALAELLEVRT